MQRKGTGGASVSPVLLRYPLHHYIGTEPINSAWQLFQRFISVYMANTETHIYIQYTELLRTEDKEGE